jgi:predicted RND superfamily exporter protein
MCPVDQLAEGYQKARHIIPPVFLALLIVVFYLSNKCPYSYGYSTLSTVNKNETQLANEKIASTFGSTNMIAMLVPAGDYEAEGRLLRELEAMDGIDSVIGLANIRAADEYVLTVKLTPRQFAELADLDIEEARLLYSSYALNDKSYGKLISGIDSFSVPLIDMFNYLYKQKQEGYLPLDGGMNKQLEDMHSKLTDAQLQLKGQNYSRFVIKLNLPEESRETTAFLDNLHKTTARYYSSGVYLVGNSTTDKDLSSSFKSDNIMISVLSAVFVVLVLLFTFQSAGLPILQILVIQGSIWINFSFPYIMDSRLFL